MPAPSRREEVVIFGAGPAGLTAGYECVRRGLHPVIFEQDGRVGGISRTVDHNGYLFDVGGHRFFTKSAEVRKIWEDLLGSEFLDRPRLSRIYYKNRFFDYPLKPVNALANLGLAEALRIVLSYAAAQIRPAGDIRTFEDWVSRKFGRRLYQIFFKTYSEKVWGIDCREIQADWAAQRIKSLTLARAVLDSLGLAKGDKATTLIDRFQYPAKGPGQMWDKARGFIESRGGRIEMNARAVRLNHRQGRILSAIIEGPQARTEARGDYYISSLPLKDLILSLDPAPPDSVVDSALRLRYRDFFTVGLIIEKRDVFPDNWIYVHSPDVRVGRVQNFKNWSPRMVPDSGRTSLGLEYFCFETDAVWKEPDHALVDLARSEIVRLGFLEPSQVVDGIVIRSKKAYPVYDSNYRASVGAIRAYLATFANLQTIGRNGLHRYNNQDHSMLTALFAVRSILGDQNSVWDVNAEEAYHESR